ncbi:MAG TPA: alpha/beta family hydrolase [Longimicrobiales bacterium]|nr:alpha/beta family hydrolase [Longimicrobiales bacterium]
MDELSIPYGDGSVVAIAEVPAGAQWLYVVAHGAGAGMRHRFMADIAGRLAGHGVATLRYEYPYMTQGSRRPDPGPKCESCTRAVVTWAAERWPGLRIAAGGKSMGGRMTSQAQAREPLPRTEAIVFLGFPLHPAGAPAVKRAEHLDDVHIPMLFLQGTRDALADLTLLTPIVERLPTATLHIVEHADHSFAVLKRSGRTGDEVMAELASRTAGFLCGDGGDASHAEARGRGEGLR